MKNILWTIIWVLIVFTGEAQDNPKVFSFNNLVSVVKAYHLVSKQADIQIGIAEAGLTEARGVFDPVLGFDAANKTFNGRNYYRYNHSSLVIPTWYGIELHAGVEYLGGLDTDPTETLGKTSYAGLSIPLAKNLVMDKRRAALKQAKLLTGASAQEKRIALNSILDEAAAAYWNWVRRYFEYQSYVEVIELNRKRIDMIRTSFIIGERAAIDTVEAETQLQQMEYLKNEVSLKLQDAGIELSCYMWDANSRPVIFPKDVIPDKRIEEFVLNVSFPDLENLLTIAERQHPELLLYRNKMEILEVEKKLKFQELLPKIDLKYNQLGKGYQLDKTIVQPLFENNYKAGITVQVPLMLRKGRGEYKQARLKIANAAIDLQWKENEIRNKIRAGYNKLVNYQIQANVLGKTYNNYRKLQQAEEVRFMGGESTVFLLNLRETKALEARIKWIEVITAFNRAAYSLQWASGQLADL